MAWEREPTGPADIRTPGKAGAPDRRVPVSSSAECCHGIGGANYTGSPT